MSRYVLTAPLIAFGFAATALVLSFLGTSIPSVYWWFTSAICGLLGIWLSIRKGNFEQQKEQRHKDCDNALKTIHQEIGNFKQIIQAQKAGQSFVGLHKKAVEIDSFEKAAESLSMLTHYWRYWWLASKGLREIHQNQGRELGLMKMEALIRTLTSLERRLTSECSK